MKYICSDCGHKANMANKGECPACSSKRFSRVQDSSNHTGKKPQKKKSIIDNPFIMIGVWLVFAYAIYDLVKSQ